MAPSPQGLNRATCSELVGSFFNRHAVILLQTPTACRHTVSDLFHSPPGVLFTFPSRYWFTIGRGRVFSLGGWSPLFQPGFLGFPSLLGYRRHTTDTCFAYRALTSCGGSFQTASAHMRRGAGYPHAGPTTPRSGCSSVWALPLSLAATWGISVDFSSSGYLDVSVPRVGSLAGDRTLLLPGCPIRTSVDLRMRAPPHGLSQLATSFIACPRLGIPRVLLPRLASSDNPCGNDRSRDRPPPGSGDDDIVPTHLTLRLYSARRFPQHPHCQTAGAPQRAFSSKNNQGR